MLLVDVMQRFVTICDATNGDVQRRSRIRVYGRSALGNARRKVGFEHSFITLYESKPREQRVDSSDRLPGALCCRDPLDSPFDTCGSRGPT